ncbi:MAG: hypothetical protein LQ348_000989 [Seirophora lacunosa]|nr:MAG: hypothetical protein LQ348_000989 [Seirophora lacunosa]
MAASRSSKVSDKDVLQQKAPKPTSHTVPLRKMESVPATQPLPNVTDGARFDQLHTLMRNTRPDTLEKGVAEGVKLLDRLRDSMMPRLADDSDVKQFIQNIDSLRKGPTTTKTVVGVVGATGAGKSSLLNALLDEERLVPTNCMRACTAVATSIEYNYEPIPYRAQIQYVQKEEWERELKTLSQDILDDGHVSKEINLLNTDAGIAWAKFKAVYPTKSSEDLAKPDSVQSLLTERDVSQLLGESCEVQDTQAKSFYQRLQALVDSKDRSSGTKKGEPAYWPLIKLVKIFLRSPILSTGLMLVDLPGVGDSNAARVAVSDKYMRDAAGLWVVAPINRAVDDKTAQSLLGQSFKRQLKMDGGVGSVTFICSKTDDISITEAQESLSLEEELSPLHERSEQLRLNRKALNTELQTLNELKANHNEVANSLDDEMEVWQALSLDVQAGPKTSTSECEPTRKRKVTGLDQAQKRQRISGSTHLGNEDLRTRSMKKENVCEDHSVVSPPSTLEEINTTIAEIMAKKKEARHEITGINERVKELRKKLDAAANELQDTEAEVTSKCISGRNAVVKGNIQADYALGIKQDDEVLAVEDEHYENEIVSRDYDEVARTLPVFCVSANGYQRLKGRLRKDTFDPKFKHIEETEIPMLQAHCIKLTEARRIADSQSFLGVMSRLLNSLAFWVSDDDFSHGMTKQQKETQEIHLASAMVQLRDNLLKTAKDTMAEVQQALGKLIFHKNMSAVQAAIADADEIVSHWAKPVNKEDRARGGYHWSTYQAICRRDGVLRTDDWNNALAEPMMKKIAPGWEKVFSQRIPSMLKRYACRAFQVLNECHDKIVRDARAVPIGEAGLKMLQGLVRGYCTVFETHAIDVQKSFKSAQRKFNRKFVPVIQEYLHPAYVACAKERGYKSFARMKSTMEHHVEQTRLICFQASVNAVRNLLDKRLEKEEQAMVGRLDGIFQSVQRDYYAVLVRGKINNIPGAEELRQSRQRMRSEVMDILNMSDNIFRGEILEPVNTRMITDDCVDVLKTAETDSSDVALHDNTSSSSS